MIEIGIKRHFFRISKNDKKKYINLRVKVEGYL